MPVRTLASVARRNRLPTVAANDVLKTVTVRRAEVTKHPLSRIGGHQAPSMRSLQSKGGPEKGGADKGDAGNAPAHRAGAAAREAALKRKRDPEREAALAREEEEFRRQKEAAKMRNEQRTKERWGLA